MDEIDKARTLRRHMTDAEGALWCRLRSRRLCGYKFRRQHPIGPYIVDFLCPARRLVVEVDGGQHTATSERDAARTRWLERRGYRVMRFWNNEVLNETDAVLESILAALDGSGA